MKLKYSFETVNMGNEIIMVPVGDNADQVHGVIKMNNEGQEIINMLMNETDAESIINTLSEKYNAEKEKISKNVHDIIQLLRDNQLLEE